MNYTDIEGLSPLISPGGFIAGGYLLSKELGTTPRDVDLWFPDNASRSATVEALLAAGYVQTGKTFTKEGELKVDVTYVTLTPQQYLDWADLTVCQMALVDGEVMYGKDTKEHVEGRLLRANPTATRFPHGWMRRVQKYMAKGFTPDDALLDLANLRTQDYARQVRSAALKALADTKKQITP